jgi:tetratricopeptide (TPR) repeat protein
VTTTVGGDFLSRYREIPLDELNQLERSADDAGELFRDGSVSNALQRLKPLYGSYLHSSSALYIQDAALCHLYLGNTREALSHLREATELSEYFHLPEVEMEALSKFGNEMQKIYIGDPYEQATRYLLLALIYLNNGEVDNALAACKSGILADSDNTENRYTSDITLLHLLEAKCYLLRDQPTSAEKSIEAACESFRTTHSQVRHLFNERLNHIALLKMTRNQRKKIGVREKDDVIEARIIDLDEQIRDVGATLDCREQLATMLSGDYNLLIAVPMGQSVNKVRNGAEANVVRFQPSLCPRIPTRIYCDGRPIDGLVTNVADIDFQAMTRGGRRMDSILAGQASFKQTSLSVGGGLIEAGNNAAGVAGLGMALLGAAISGVASEISAEADTRCWNFLPGELAAIPLTVVPGTHIIEFDDYLYFERRQLRTQRVVVEDPSTLKVVFAPYPSTGLYTPQAVTAEASLRRSRKGRGTPVLLPPPLGIDFIEFFPTPDPQKYPRSLSPDPRRLMRMAEKTLRNHGLNGKALSHTQATNRNPEDIGDAPHALQTTLIDLAYAVDRKNETYTCTFNFKCIDVASGDVLLTENIAASQTKKRKDKFPTCTDVFYACYEQALTEFVTADGFTTAGLP